MSVLFVKPQLWFLASRYSDPFQSLKNNIMLLKIKSFLLSKGSFVKTNNCTQVIATPFQNSLNSAQLQWKSKASSDYSEISATISLKGTFILLSQEDWIWQDKMCWTVNKTLLIFPMRELTSWYVSLNFSSQLKHWKSHWCRSH